MTVSRVLRGHPSVHPRTRELVQRWADQLGYRPHRWARSLVTRSSRIIGVVIPDISHSYFAEITAGIEEMTEAAGYDLLLCHSRLDPLRERNEINMLRESRVDGLIVASEQGSEMFREMQQKQFPFVLVDRYFPPEKMPSVHVDDEKVGRLATEHLLSLGHTCIGHIQGASHSVGLLRGRGYLQALRAHRVAVRRERIINGDFSIDSGKEAMKKLLALPQRPTAVFAANDPMAIGAIHACREAGLRVPEDISVVGSGDIEGASHPRPFLTTISWPSRELGRIAGRILLETIANPERSPEEKVLEPRLAVRESTAPLASAALPATQVGHSHRSR